jgi:sarcosine oxidase subunit gamma
MADAASLVRVGLKGPRAADWLAEAKIRVPAQSNTWSLLDAANSSWGMVARLGSTEFFLEEEGSNPRLRVLTDALADGAPQVYPVLRQDRALVLGGAGVESILAQVCNVDFAALDLAAQPAVLTLMIGVAVVVVPQPHGTGRRYRIWCDPSFGHYLWSTLEGILGESGGETVDIGDLRDGPQVTNNERKPQ